MIDFSLYKKLHADEGSMLLELACRIEKGRFIGLYGPSGAGKTSVLRMLAGLMKPDDGYIHVNNEVWFSRTENSMVSVRKRKIGFVFQDYALFPNMNVRENVSYALEKGNSKGIVDQLLDLTGLRGFALRKVTTLSGGQQQRVALARALVRRPELLLLDEPLSAIDQSMREQLQEVILKLHRQFELTTLMVSHDTFEISRLADQVLHLDKGRRQEFTSPSVFFARLSGQTGEVSGTVLDIINRNTERLLVLAINGTVAEISLQGNSESELPKGAKIKISFNQGSYKVEKSS